MTPDEFSVSVKGIVCQNGKILLRKNQRKEYELIGGKFDADVFSSHDQLVKEFMEEAGAKIEVLSLRFPWLYLIGKKNIIVAPYICELLSLDRAHRDEDGGKIIWVNTSDIESIFLPRGYCDSIFGRIPRTSFSPDEGVFLKFIPNYVEFSYYIKIIVTALGGSIILDEYLRHYCSPLDLLKGKLDIDFLYPLKIEKVDKVVSVHYIYFK